jgi:hypothetical protein
MKKYRLRSYKVIRRIRNDYVVCEDYTVEYKVFWFFYWPLKYFSDLELAESYLSALIDLANEQNEL